MRYMLAVGPPRSEITPVKPFTVSRIASTSRITESSERLWMMRPSCSVIEQKVHPPKQPRWMEIEKRIKPALREGAFKRFLFAPHPMLDNFPPADLLQSGYSFQRLLGFVENALGGDVS